MLNLDRLVFVPAAAQPLKTHVTAAPPAQRLEMVELLVADDSRFAVDPIEIEREGLSYTVHTLETYAERYPAAERFLLVGADVLPTFSAWRDPARLPELARLVVLRRGAAVAGVGGGAGEPATGSGDDSAGFGAATAIETRRVDVSSTEIRARVRAGLSIRGFVVDAVADYIAATGLYR